MKEVYQEKWPFNDLDKSWQEPVVDFEQGESTACLFLHLAPFGRTELTQTLSLKWHVHFKQGLYSILQ